MNPTSIYLIGIPALLYLRAAHVLAGRGYRIPAFQQACWFGGLTAIGIALLSPLDHLGDTDLVSAHMAQHLLLVDIAAPLLVLGLRTPAYAFMLPRPLLVPLARNRVLRKLFSALRNPFIAATIFIAVMWSWHLAPAYDAALESPVVHALQHQCFLIAGMIFWLPVLEPWRRRVPGGLWKIGYVGGTRLLSMFVGFALVATREPIYTFYGSRALDHGLTPLSDQQLAGTLMMVFDVLIVLGALVFFFMRTAQDESVAEQDQSGPPPGISEQELAAASLRERGGTEMSPEHAAERS